MLDQTRTWFETIPLPILVISPQGRVTASNSAADQLVGLGSAGRHHVTVLRQPDILETIEQTMADGRARQSRFRSADQVWIASIQGLPAPDGVLITFNDRTEVEVAHEMRRDFVANVSHELRTPLTAMIGFLDTLTGPAKDDEKARDRFLTIMQSEATRMSRLVDDLLSLTRVEATSRSRPQEREDLSLLCQSVASAMEPIAVAQDATLRLDLQVDEVICSADADQIKQVLTNLIENAVKYGGTNIDLVLERCDQVPALTGPVARLTVADDGPGIAPHHLARLTERFYRVDTHRARDAGGTGLGLAIVKHIVTRHRGRLTIESAPGKGSRFIVDLPLD